VERLKRERPGASLPLAADELLMARAVHPSVGGEFIDVRMRVARTGSAERSEHRLGGGVTPVFRHFCVSLSPQARSALELAVQSALVEGAGLSEECDSQAAYRTLEVRNGAKAVKLAVEYRAGHAVVSAPAFQKVWDLLKLQFAGGEGSSNQDEYP
jgi:hypothetical protein